MPPDLTLIFDKPPYNSILNTIKALAAASGTEVYLVGGAVRDLIRGVSSNDLDFVVFRNDYLAFAKKAAKSLKRPYIPFKDNVRIPCGDGYIDISAPRGDSIEADLSKRDFTVNNLAMDMEGRIIGDFSDIEKKIIRPVYNRLFDDDPLRILRGFRQAASLDYSLSEAFFTLAVPAVPKLAGIPGERIHDELRKLSAAKANSYIYETMQSSGVWKQILGFEPDPAILLKTITGAGNYNENERFALCLAALLAGSDTKATSVLKRLCVSHSTSELTQMLLKKSSAIGSAAPDEMKKIVWRLGDRLDILLYYTEIRHNLPKSRISEYISLADSMDRKRADTADGNLLLKLIETTAPGTPQGKWMADILEDVKIKLSFDGLNNKKEAEEYIVMKIKLFTGAQ